MSRKVSRQPTLILKVKEAYSSLC